MNSKELFKADSTTKIKHLNENDYAVLLNQKGWQIYELDKDENFNLKSAKEVYFSIITEFNSYYYMGYEMNNNNKVLINRKTGEIILSLANNTKTSIEPLGDRFLLKRGFGRKGKTITCTIFDTENGVNKEYLLKCKNVSKMCDSVIKVQFENDPTDHFYSCLREFKELSFLNQYFPTEILELNEENYIVASSKTRCTYVVNKTSGNYAKKFEFYFKVDFNHDDYIVLSNAFNKNETALILKQNMLLSPLFYDYNILGENYFFLLTNPNRGLGTILRRSDFSTIATNIDYDAIAIAYSNNQVIFFDSNTKAWHLAK